jgi:hypothetical protein
MTTAPATRETSLNNTARPCSLIPQKKKIVFWISETYLQIFNFKKYKGMLHTKLLGWITDHGILFFFFWDRLLLCNPGWSWTHDPLVSVFLVLGLQAGTTMPGDHEVLNIRLMHDQERGSGKKQEKTKRITKSHLPFVTN